MARQKYIDKKFKPKSLELIATINAILAEYSRANYAITVRSLYYQLVARGYIPNTEKSYKGITNLVSDARLAGLLDWDHVEDRMRAFKTRGRWASGSQILRDAAGWFHMDMWKTQRNRVFTIIEKDALGGIIEGTCRKFDVPMLAARGYPSSSVVREFVKDVLIPAALDGQDIVVLHLGDHDPSGIDMSRDLEERINLFSEGHFAVDFRRLGLNMDQIEDQRPPPNPAKVTDSRFEEYQKLHGDESWELDALSPRFTNEILSDEIETFIDWTPWEEREAEIQAVKDKLVAVAKDF